MITTNTNFQKMIIQKVSMEDNIYILTFEQKRMLGTNEFDLIAKMENNTLKNILQGTVLTYGEWLDIEDYAVIEEFTDIINSFIADNRELITFR